MQLQIGCCYRIFNGIDMPKPRSSPNSRLWFVCYVKVVWNKVFWLPISWGNLDYGNTGYGVPSPWVQNQLAFKPKAEWIQIKLQYLLKWNNGMFLKNTRFWNIILYISWKFLMIQILGTILMIGNFHITHVLENWPIFCRQNIKESFGTLHF